MRGSCALAVPLLAARPAASGAGVLSTAGAAALRPCAGTGTVVRLRGRGSCGTVEGWAIGLDHAAPAPCGGTAATHPGWGSLKARHR